MSYSGTRVRLRHIAVTGWGQREGLSCRHQPAVMRHLVSGGDGGRGQGVGQSGRRSRHVKQWTCSFVYVRKVWLFVVRGFEPFFSLDDYHK